ncbi:hypothetical protein N0V84_000866 [Fusarium piperis]|uniref:Uncharacterized protein n=1 Tax=Fusarium piperis TaxID=1435070 RepID=A0A9W8WM40_9HYPO|nr:hypothetical protein N0V84_000866 [Fusarium piperis]
MAMHLDWVDDSLRYWKLSELHWQIYKSAANLTNLRHLILSRREDELFGFCHHGVKAVLRAAPALKTLILQETLWLGDDNRRSSSFNLLQVFVPALKNLTTLQLKKLNIPWDKQDLEHKAFCKVIEMAEILRHFSYLARCVHSQRRDRRHIAPGNLVDALKPRAETLEILEIGVYDLNSRCQHDDIYELPKIERSAISQFRSLHTLRVHELSICRHFDLEAAKKWNWNCISDILLPDIKHFTMGLDVQCMVGRKDVTRFGEDVVPGNSQPSRVSKLFSTLPHENDENMWYAKYKSAKLRARLDKAFRGSEVKVSIFPEGGYCSEYGPDYISDRSPDEFSNDDMDSDDE